MEFNLIHFIILFVSSFHVVSSQTEKQFIYDFSICDDNCNQIMDELFDLECVKDIIPSMRIALIQTSGNLDYTCSNSLVSMNKLGSGSNISSNLKLIRGNPKTKKSNIYIKKYLIESKLYTIVKLINTYFRKLFHVIKYGSPDTWGFEYVKADKVKLYELDYLKSPPIIGVIDMGIDIFHPYLINQIYFNDLEKFGDSFNDGFPGVMGDDDNDGRSDFDDYDVMALIKRLVAVGVEREDAKAIAAMDDDENGYPDDFMGWNFMNENNNALPLTGFNHGTEVAGVISSSAPRKALGLSLKSRQVPIKLYDGSDHGETTVWQFLRAIDYIVKRGGNIINYSGDFRYKGSSNIEELKVSQKLICTKLLEHEDVVLVASAPNERGENVDLFDFNENYIKNRIFPSACINILGNRSTDNLVIVTGHMRPETSNRYFNIKRVSNVCSEKSIHIAAPAEEIGTLGNSFDGLIYKQTYRTSAAAPFITGGIALLMSTEKFKNCNSVQTKNIILKYAIKNVLGRCSNQGKVLNLFKAYNDMKESEDCK